MSLFGRIILPIGTKPKNGWIKWYHMDIPDAEGEAREQARNQAEQQQHCKVCTVLSGDYFPSFNMPMYPQHRHCDCMLFSVSKPITEGVASCAIEKFTAYVFVPSSSKGKTKIFTDLGYTIEDSESLKSEFERQAKYKYLSGNYALQHLDEYGQRITVTIELKAANKNVKIKTGWMVRPSGLITCATPFTGVEK